MGGILFCHGSPRRDTDRITIATPAERILEWCEGAKEQTIVCGHTHAQFKRQIDGWTIVNPGSVGNSFGNPGAYWAVFDSGCALRFTSYDTSAVAQQVLDSGFPRAERMANELLTPDPIEHSVRSADESDPPKACCSHSCSHRPCDLNAAKFGGAAGFEPGMEVLQI